MSVLTVVRHGQASFLADNYDQLSTRGELQARLLGQYWTRRQKRFDRVIYGPCERQIRTGEIAGGILREAGLPWPEPEVRDEFDEFPAEPVMRTLGPLLLERHTHLREIADTFYSASVLEEKRRAFDKLLREVSLRWLDREIEWQEMPTWDGFCARVERGIDAIREESGKGTNIALFTSAGPMAVTASVALQLTPRATMELTWSPRNACFSEFPFTSGRFSMSTFNCISHLEGPEFDGELVTYR